MAPLKAGKLLVPCLCVGLAACATGPSRAPIEANGSPHKSHWGAVQLHDADANSVSHLTDGSKTASPELNVLAISGGGSDGANGAGLLTGWSASGKRPAFDVVTGVSTGGLLAALAFLGSEYDPEIERSYTTVTNDDIYASNGVQGLLGESLLDNGPLKRRIARIIDTSHLDRVAEEHRKGRRLYVATTNLDAGDVVVWDMGAIAASGEKDRLQLFREILAASAAVPGFFQPGYIHADEDDTTGQMHVDGGVKAPVLLKPFMLVAKQKAKHVYMIINGKLALRSTGGHVEPNLVDISKRSIAELMRGLTYRTVYQDYVAVVQAKAKFHLAYVPDDGKENANALEFDPAEMRKLFQAGHDAGVAGGGWQPEPPRLEPAERVGKAAL